MPEGRRFPFNYLPRFGTKLSVTFGDPIPPDEILAALRRTTGLPHDVQGKPHKWIADPVAGLVDNTNDEAAMKAIRIEVTSLIQRAV